jgi:hypothetical protein
MNPELNFFLALAVSAPIASIYIYLISKIYLFIHYIIKFPKIASIVWRIILFILSEIYLGNVDEIHGNDLLYEILLNSGILCICVTLIYISILRLNKENFRNKKWYQLLIFEQICLVCYFIPYFNDYDYSH